MEPYIRVIIVSIAAVLLTGEGSGVSAKPTMYQPQVGDEVVLYTHIFKPEYFDEGEKIVVEGFGDAMTELGQTRYTYFVSDQEKSEVVAIYFFKKGHSVDEWHDSKQRLEVLKRLKPLWKEPVSVHRYTLTAKHSAN